MIPLISEEYQVVGNRKKLAPVYWLLSLLFQFTGRYGIEF